MNDIFKLQDVSDAELAFPAMVSHLMPAYDNIPDEFKRHDGTQWNELVSKWFYGGVKGLQFVRKPGVNDKTCRKALRQFRCILGSYEPKHEHKEAACAYLLSRFFDGYTLNASGKIEPGVYIEQSMESA
jgi:hypothetical protein